MKFEQEDFEKKILPILEEADRLSGGETLRVFADQVTALAKLAEGTSGLEQFRSRLENSIRREVIDVLQKVPRLFEENKLPHDSLSRVVSSAKDAGATLPNYLDYFLRPRQA